MFGSLGWGLVTLSAASNALPPSAFSLRSPLIAPPPPPLQDYAAQRMFGSLGWCLIAPLAGVAVERGGFEVAALG